MAEQGPIVARKVYFFRIEHFADVKDALPGILQRIENLPFSDTGRYFVEPKGEARLCVFPDTLQYPLMLRFGKTRRDLLPDVEKSGQLGELDLAEDEGLIDIGHVVIFDDGHVASEWNPEAPKLQRLTPYLLDKGDVQKVVRFRNLFQRDIVDAVSSLNNVRMLSIDLPPESVEVAREADDNLADALDATERLGATKRTGLTLTAHQQGSAKLKDLALKLAGIIQARPQERGRFNNITATGVDSASGVTRYIDILENKLVLGEMFPRKNARSRSIDKDEAYRLLQRSYLEMKPKLKDAATSGDM
jgi:hypothetical protein